MRAPPKAQWRSSTGAALMASACRRSRSVRGIVKFGHGPANRLGERLRHLVEAFGVCYVNAGEFDSDRRRGDRAQLAHRSGDGDLWGALESLYKLALCQSGQLPA